MMDATKSRILPYRTSRVKGFKSIPRFSVGVVRPFRRRSGIFCLEEPMKRLIFLLLTLSLLLSACAPAGTETAFYTFTDDLGREVSLSEPPERVACLLGSFADVWFLAGGSVIAAPDDAWEDFSLPMPEDATVLGSAKNLSLELLLASEPDLILASANTAQHLQWLDTLTASGIPIACFDVADFEDYLRLLKIATDLTGRPDLYERNGLAVKAQIEQARAQAQTHLCQSQPPKVLYLRLAASGIRVKNSHGNVLGEMLRSLGCENIADADASLLENLSMEHILAQDPDIIFLVPQGDDTEGTQKTFDAFVSDHPAWQTLTAVREGRVYTLEKALYSLKPNARWGQAYLALVELIWNEP